MGSCISKSKARTKNRPELGHGHLQRIYQDVRLAPPAAEARISRDHHRSIHELPAEPMPVHANKYGDEKATPISIATDDFETRFIPDERVLARKLKILQAKMVLQGQEIKRLRLGKSAADAMRDEALEDAALARSELDRRDKALQKSRARIRKLEERIGVLEDEKAVLYEVLKTMKDASTAIEVVGVDEDWKSCREERSVFED